MDLELHEGKYVNFWVNNPFNAAFFWKLIADGYYELEVQQKLHDFKKCRFSENSNSIWVWNNIRVSE